MNKYSEANLLLDEGCHVKLHRRRLIMTSWHWEFNQQRKILFLVLTRICTYVHMHVQDFVDTWLEISQK